MTDIFDGPAVVRAGQGREIAALGMWRKVGGEHFGGRLLVMEGVIPPGALIDAHTHTREDECTFILDGELSYLVGEQVAEVTAGQGGRIRPAGEDAEERLALPGRQPFGVRQQYRPELACRQPFQPFFQRGQELAQAQRSGTDMVAPRVGTGCCWWPLVR